MADRATTQVTRLPQVLQEGESRSSAACFHPTVKLLVRIAYSYTLPSGPPDGQWRPPPGPPPPNHSSYPGQQYHDSREGGYPGQGYGGYAPPPGPPGGGNYDPPRTSSLIILVLC